MFVLFDYLYPLSPLEHTRKRHDLSSFLLLNPQGLAVVNVLEMPVARVNKQVQVEGGEGTTGRKTSEVHSLLGHLRPEVIG